MKIPFVDLKTQYESIKDEINESIQHVIDETSFIEGHEVETFRQGFAGMHGARYCVATSSGTSALHLALWASGISSGDEVIIPVNTYFATAEAVSLTGAIPVFVDHDPGNFNIDVTKIEGKITNRTKAILPVHLYGQPADMGTILDIADKNNLLVVEDCAQAHLAEYMGKPVGTFGHAGCFSFYPGKNLGAYGEGGAVITNNEDLYDKMLLLHDHGSRKKYYHEMIGHNYRMNNFQGAVLGVKLKYIEQWTNMRRENARLYQKKLNKIDEIVVFNEMSYARHVYHLFVLLVENRPELQQYLQNHGITTGLHYPVPLHLQKAYDFLNLNGASFPVTTEYMNKILSLPMYPELTEKQIDYVVSKIKQFYKK